MSKYRVEIVSGTGPVSVVEDQITDKLRVFQKAQWLNIVGAGLKAAICYDDKGDIKGYMPLVKSRKFRITGFHIPPYTPFFGPVILEDDLFKKGSVVEALIKPFFGEKHLDYLLRLEDSDVLSYSRLGFSIEARQTHVVPVTVNYGIDHIHSSKKRYLKKLLDQQKQGNLIVRKGLDAVSDLLKLNNATENRAGFSGRNDILQNLVKEFANEETVAVVYTKEGQALAGAFCPKDASWAYHIINASARNDDSLLDKSNLLSTYNMVMAAKDSGIGFDFEGSNIPGVANFYRMMGGIPTVNFRLQKSRSLPFGLMRAVQRIRNEQHAN